MSLVLDIKEFKCESENGNSVYLQKGEGFVILKCQAFNEDPYKTVYMSNKQWFDILKSEYGRKDLAVDYL